MNNTQKKIELEHQDRMQSMTSINHQAFARTIWDSPKKAKDYYEFWHTVKHNAEPDSSLANQAELGMATAMAIMVEMGTLNAGFYSAKVASQLDSVNNIPIVVKEDTTTVEEIIPDVKDDKKTVPLYKGDDLGDKPTHEEISKAVKALLSENKEEDALALARKYFGTGNFTPKKEKQSPDPWPEKQLESWIKSLKANMKKQTPKKEDNADEAFGQHKATLAEETKALNDFADKYISLATSGTENVDTAEELCNLFFKQRHYSSKQVTAWKQAVTASDKPEHLDHFAILGVPGTTNGKLKDNEKSYESIVEMIRKHMKDTQITKPKLKNKETMLDYLLKEVDRKFGDNLLGTFFKNKNDVGYSMYTKPHVDDFIERVVMANFTELDSKATTSKEDGQKKVQDSDSKKKQSVPKKLVGEVAKKVANEVKNITTKIIKNGGILEDTIDNENYNKLVGENKPFEKVEDLQEYINANFGWWEIEYKNAQKTYPLNTFARSIEMAVESGIMLEAFIEEAKSYMIKPNGGILTLKGKAEETVVETIFEHEKMFVEFVTTQYNAAKKAYDEREAAKEKLRKEAGVEKTEDADKGTGADTGGISDADDKVSDLVVPDYTIKVSYVEQACYKAIKKGKDMTSILKDPKISKLVQGGGHLSVNKDVKETYDTTSESLDKLIAALTSIYERIYLKKHPKSVAEKVADLKNPENTKKDDDKSESKITVLETDSSVITSINQIPKAGMKLIEAGCSKEDFLKWGQEVLLNRKMKEQHDNAVLDSVKKVDNFIKSMFSDFFKEEGDEDKTENKLTPEHLADTVKSASKEEGKTYISLVKEVNNLCNDNNLDLKVSERLDMVRVNAPELYKKHLSNIQKQRDEQQEKVVVHEKISETNTTMWDKVKDFKTLDEIYNTSIELCETGDWNVALNMATELISGGEIKGAENWTNDQIAKWFDTMILRKEVSEETETKKENTTKPKVEAEFNAITKAKKGNDFRAALIQVLSNHEDTPELRDKVLGAIKNGKGNFVRRMAKNIGTNSESKIHDQITSAKQFVDSKNKKTK
jgi:hypothetical protein